MVQVQAVDVGRGISWIGEGWRTFTRNPGMWIALCFVTLILFMVLMLVPFLGGLALSLVYPALMAGLLFAAQEANADRPIEIAHLFRAFQDSPALNGLLALGGISILGFIVTMVIAAITMGGVFMAAMQAGSTPMAWLGAIGIGGLLGLLLATLVQLFVMALLFYAIPLVMFVRTPVGDAMRASVNACITNVIPLLIFSLIYLVLAIVASIPLGLGWLVLMPASVGMWYASYRDIFRA